MLAAGAANGALVEVVGKGPSYVVSNTSQVVYQQFTASNNQTMFTVSGGYVPGMVDVYVEGIKLVNGTDVNVSSGNNIVLSTGIPNNSLVEVRGVFTPINPSSTAGVRQTFTANSTVNNNFTVTGGYIPGFVDVYYNGSKLVNGSDVNVSSGTTVVLATNAAANAIVDVVGINYYTNAGGVTTPVRQSFTASANQTTFTVTGGYTPGMIDVYQNGVKLVNGADVNVSGGSTVVLATGAANNDTIDVVGFSAVSYQDAVKKSGDAMTGSLIVSGNVGIGISTIGASTKLQVETGQDNYLNITSGVYSLYMTGDATSSHVPVIGVGSGQPLTFHTNGSERMRISPTGVITKPYHPSFSAILGSSLATSGSAVVAPFNTAITNIGSNYNTSTYRFTAPVAGSYVFLTRFQKRFTGTMQIILYKNGSQLSRLAYTDTSNDGPGIVGTALIYLNASDYVQLYYTLSAGDVYGDSGEPWYGSIFYGYLLG